MQNDLIHQISEMFGAPENAGDDTPATRDKVETGGPPWVLHIEDDIHFSQALRNRLSAHGVVAVRAFDGMEGFRFAFQYPASVIILDYHLPNGRGDYILRRLKESPATADIPVVIVTGAADRALERRFRAAGAAGFLGKPLDMEVLVTELRKYIDILPSSVDGLALENAGYRASRSAYATHS